LPKNVPSRLRKHLERLAGSPKKWAQRPGQLGPDEAEQPDPHVGRVRLPDG